MKSKFLCTLLPLVIVTICFATCQAGCLKESELLVGGAKGDPFSHMDELQKLEEAGKNDYKVLSFKTCEDGKEDNLSGI